MRQGPAIGVDGYPGGWVAVHLAAGRFERAWAASDLTTLLAGLAAGATVGIDIPIGGVQRGWRAADHAARAALGPRRSSVFLVPPRPVWTEPTHAAASVRCRELTGSGLSMQSYRLLPKMLEAERFTGTELHEVHPELVFQRLNGGATVPYGKKTWNGQTHRRALLAGVDVVLPDDLGTAGAVPPDDLLDAAAVAWCAGRIARSEAVPLPDVPEYDVTGRRIAIWS